MRSATTPREKIPVRQISPSTTSVSGNRIPDLFMPVASYCFWDYAALINFGVFVSQLSQTTFEEAPHEHSHVSCVRHPVVCVRFRATTYHPNQTGSAYAANRSGKSSPSRFYQEHSSSAIFRSRVTPDLRVQPLRS